MSPKITHLHVDSTKACGRRIRQLRLERELSQRALAANTLGVSYAYISRIEAGARQPSLQAINRLANVLGVDPHWLATGEPDPVRTAAALVVDAWRSGDALAHPLHNLAHALNHREP